MSRVSQMGLVLISLLASSSFLNSAAAVEHADQIPLPLATTRNANPMDATTLAAIQLAPRDDLSLPPVISTRELQEWRSEEDIIAYRDATTLASESAVFGHLRSNASSSGGSPMRTLFAMLAIFGLLASGMGCLSLARV